MKKKSRMLLFFALPVFLLALVVYVTLNTNIAGVNKKYCKVRSPFSSGNEKINAFSYYQNIQKFVVFLDIWGSRSSEHKAFECLEKNNFEPLKCVGLKLDYVADHDALQFIQNASIKFAAPFNDKNEIKNIIREAIHEKYTQCMDNIEIVYVQSIYAPELQEDGNFGILFNLEPVPSNMAYDPAITVTLYRPEFSQIQFYDVYRATRYHYSYYMEDGDFNKDRFLRDLSGQLMRDLRANMYLR